MTDRTQPNYPDTPIDSITPDQSISGNNLEPGSIEFDSEKKRRANGRQGASHTIETPDQTNDLDIENPYQEKPDVNLTPKTSH